MKRKTRLNFASVIITACLVLFCFNTAEATVYKYRQPVVISNTGSARTFYQVQFTINTASLISSGHIAQSNGNDIRFSRADNFDDSTWTASGKPNCSYWIEDGSLNTSASARINQDSTEIWVEVDSIAVGTVESPGQTTLYMYYGSASAAAGSSGRDTFSLFDNFSSTPAQWTGTGTYSTTTTGSATATNSSGGTSTSTLLSDNMGDNDYTAKLKVTSTAGTYTLQKVNSGGATDVTTSPSPITFTLSGPSAQLKLNATATSSQSGCSQWTQQCVANSCCTRDAYSNCVSNNCCTTINVAPCIVLSYSTATSSIAIDDVFVYQTATPAPTAGAWQDEQIVTQSFSVTSSSYSPVVSSGSGGATITITAKDSAGVAVADYSGTGGATVNLSVSGSATLSSATIAASSFNASGQATVTLTNTVAEDVTVTATSSTPYTYITGSSSTISFTPAAIASYAVSSASPQTVGIGWSATVTAKDAYNNTVTNDSSTSVTMTNSGAALFYTSDTYGTTTTAYTLSSGVATVYAKDTTAQTITLTATDANTKTGVSGSVVVNPAAIASYVVSSASPQTAGTGWSATVTAKDAYNNTVTNDSSTSVTMTNSGAALFYTSDTYGTTTTAYTLSSGVATVYAKDTTAQTITLTATDANTKTGVSGSVIIRHASADHLAFATNITTPQTASSSFNLPAIKAYDQYNNFCDGANGATAYSGTKTISYALSGTANSPNGTLDNWTTSVDFASGASTTTLATTLYRKQSTTITPSVSDLSGTNSASNSIDVNAATKTKIVFTQQPSSSSYVNVVLAQAPIVTIQDDFGNQTTDTDSLIIKPSTSGTDLVLASGTLSSSHTGNTLAATSGSATFSGVKYNTIQTIYLHISDVAESLQPAISSAIVFGKASTSTVEVAATLVSDFNITSTNDTEDEKFTVLKFKVKDDGSDSVPTLIDKIQITVGGTGGNASTDIAWAGLYVGETQVATATGAAITNSAITFGSTPNGNSTAAVYSITDNGTANSVEFIVYAYMKNSKLGATETQTYTFDINEDGVGTDTSASSQMKADQGNITPVTGTIVVSVDHLEIVNVSDGSAAISVTAGQTNELSLRATDANKNIDINYTGTHTLKFSGLNVIGSWKPKIKTVALGYSMGISFSSGVSVVASDPVTLTAYKAESGTLSVQDMDSGHTGYAAFTLAATVSAANAYQISSTSGDPQSGKTSAALANPFIVTVTDQYGNAVSGTAVTFAVSSRPNGAGPTDGVVSVTNATTNSSGQASTILTLGSIGGTYQVTATSGTLSGSPVTFSATALAPANLNIISGNPQTNTITSTISPFVVKLTDSDATPVPNTNIAFSVLSSPSGAAGYALSASSATTDANGLASVTLTLGDKVGDYVVRASISGLNVDFTATATAGLVYKVVLSGPGSITAGSINTVTPFTITLKDVSDNLKSASGNTVFTLSTSNLTTGSFYSDSDGNISISTKTVSAGFSSATFYYKDTVTGNAAVTVTRNSGDSLTVAESSYTTNIVAANLSYFKVTSNDSTLTAGGSSTITIKGYDTENNLKTNLNGDYTITFSGANTSPSPKSQSPTCSDKTNSDTNFGTGTTLTFSSGAVTSTLKLYTAEVAHIKAAVGAVTTSDANDLDITVKHTSVDHLKFTADIPTPGGGFNVGTQFPLGTLNALDVYDNLCDGANSATAYSGTKTVNYSLSGSVDAPDGSQTDSWTTSVGFTAGASTTTLNTTLYRAQTTTITPSTSGLSGTNIASNSITVASGAVAKLYYTQQPSTDTPIYPNVALPRQPRIAVADQYGNAATSISDQITLAASTTSGTFTAVTNGTLTGESLSVNTSNGTATFSGIKYSYPETIYLRAHSENNRATDIYSNAVAFSLGVDTTFAAGSLSEPASISSLIYADASKVQVFDFKVTDVGSDGYATKIKQIAITRGASDTTAGWVNYISGATISNGTTTVMGAISDDALTFGDGNSVIYTVNDNANKTFTLSIYLAQTLPSGADGKVINFDIDPNDDITLDSLSSTFASAASLTSSLTVNVVATKFIVTGSVSTVNAGVESTVTLKLTDINGNIDTNGYEGAQAVIFSGANTAPNGVDKPKCKNYVTTPIIFGNDTLISFSSGQGTSAMTLYKAETISIKAKLSADATVTTADADDLDIKVNGGTASKLSWDTQPYETIVANSPWRPFKVAVADAYDNVASSSTTVTLTALGGTITSGATSSVTAVSGIANFNNFSVYCLNYPGTVTLNASASGVTDSGASSAVTVVEKYAVTLKVIDSVNGSALTDLTLKVLDAATGLAIDTLSPNPRTGNSPLQFLIPYGKYQFNLNKTAYVESTEEKTTDISADAADSLYDNDISWTIFLVSVAESLADYRVLSNFVYDEDSDILTASMRLEKRGKQIVDDAVNTLKTCTFNVYSSTDATTPIYTDSLATADANGNYWFSITDAVDSEGFASGKSYFAKMTILYGGSNLSTNVTYSAVSTFDIGVASFLKQQTDAIRTEVTGVKTTVSTEGAATRTKVASEATDVKTKVADESTTVQTKVAAVKTETASILTAAETTIPAKITTAQENIMSNIDTDIEPHIKAGILNRENLIKLGSTIVIQYRTVTGKSPTLTVYAPNNTIKLSGAIMTEVGTTGVYEYSVPFASGWGVGEFTVVCSESTLGTVDAIVITAVRHDIDEIAGQTASILGATAGLSSLKNVSDTISSQFKLLDQALGTLSEKIVSKVEGTKSIVSDLESVYNQLGNLSKQIKGIGGTVGISLDKLYEVSKDKKEDINYLKNKAEELKAVMDLNKKMMENVAKKPVVQTWFEYR